MRASLETVLDCGEGGATKSQTFPEQWLEW